MSFEIPDHVRPIRDAVHAFVTEQVEPAEPVLYAGGPEATELMTRLQADAKEAGLWALGHPVDIGGGGMPFLDYVFVNEVQGRTEFGQIALGTLSLQDSIMLNKHASSQLRESYLMPLVRGEITPSFGMTEPEVASSDPTQLETTAVLDGDEWVINGRKWFTTGAAQAAYTAVMCRTEPDAAAHSAFSIIIVPTDTPGYRFVRETPVLGMESGHYEVAYDNARVPADNLLGERGTGFVIAQERLGPGRIFHAMRWLGQAQRAFDLMCERLNSRVAFGEPLARKQLLQEHVFESFGEIQSVRLMTMRAAEKIDRGEQTREEVGVIKVLGARMLHNVVDRALQVHGALGLTDDAPLSRMYRNARLARVYDGPDEVHMHSVSRRLLGQYARGENWEFGLS